MEFVSKIISILPLLVSFFVNVAFNEMKPT